MSHDDATQDGPGYGSAQTQQTQQTPPAQPGGQAHQPHTASGATPQQYGQDQPGQTPAQPQQGQGQAAYGQTQQLPDQNGPGQHGQAPYGQQNQAPYGQAPYGQGQPSYQGQPGQPGYGQAQPGHAPYGQTQTGQTAYGQNPYARPQYGQGGQTGPNAYGGATASSSGGPQTLTAYPSTDTTSGTPGASPTGPLPQSGFGNGGQPPLPPNGKKRRDMGQPGWRGVIATGLGAALVASLLTAGVVLAVDNDNDNSSSALASTSQSEPAVKAPVTTSSAENPDWEAVASAVEPSVVSVQVTSAQSEGEGSGVILDKTGRIVTNNHVVDGATTIEVVLNDGRKYSAKVVGTDSTTDLAVIQLQSPPDNLTPATFGSTDTVKVGDAVMAVGNPLGLAGTVTTGIVSAVDRPVTTSASETQSSTSTADEVVTNAIQIDAAVNPGNSGGALVDSEGRIIGINSSIATLSQSSGFGDQTSSQSGSIGLGFAIPVDQVKDITNQLIKSGTAQHPWLGITLSDATVSVDSAQRDGAAVESVVASSPAADAGLKKGDTVIAIDGEYVNGAESLMAQVRERAAGTEVTVTIVRDGKSQDVKVTLATRPASQN